MTIKRWVIRRKSDGLYIGRNADHVNLFEAELYESEEEANLDCYDSNEEPIPVRVTIEEEPAPLPGNGGLREALKDEIVRLMYAGHGHPFEDRRRFCPYEGKGACPDCEAVDRMDSALSGSSPDDGGYDAILAKIREWRESTKRWGKWTMPDTVIYMLDDIEKAALGRSAETRCACCDSPSREGKYTCAEHDNQERAAWDAQHARPAETSSRDEKGGWHDTTPSPEDFATRSEGTSAPKRWKCKGCDLVGGEIGEMIVGPDGTLIHWDEKRWCGPVEPTGEEVGT